MSKVIIKTVDFSSDFSDIEKIRSAVFIKEQNVPVELEWDEFDDDSTHILAYYDNKPVGTARLLSDGHIGRMAVLKEYRNRNIGRNMLKYIIDIAQKRSIRNIELSAQEHAVDFYKKYGFSVTSDVYMDAGIPHYNMIYDGNLLKMPQ
jgi:predicted GNAT family N-acyltransferase